jgi:hypothetical protein
MGGFKERNCVNLEILNDVTLLRYPIGINFLHSNMKSGANLDAI